VTAEPERANGTWVPSRTVPGTKVIRLRTWVWTALNSCTCVNLQVSYECGDVRAVKLGPGLYKLDLTGRLTLNGVTRVQVGSSQVTVRPYSLRATGNFEIQQSDFGIARVNVAGGLLTLKGELKFAFFIVARQDGASENVCPGSTTSEVSERSPISH
jgi:hypothetical protein